MMIIIISLYYSISYICIDNKAGPRTCLGQNFAILEMKCTLARLLCHYEFKLEQSAESVTYSNSLTLPIKGIKYFIK